MSEVLELQTNVPVEVALKFADGKTIETKRGPRVLFTLDDDRVMFFNPPEAEKIRSLGIGPGERFRLCKAEIKQGQRYRGHELQVARIDPDPRWNQPAPSPAPARPEPLAPPPAKDNGASAPVQNGGHPSNNGQSSTTANGTGYAPVQVQFGDAMQEFLVAAGRASRHAEVILGADGASVRFDNRDIAATATTMFIEAARRGCLIWTPGGLR